MIGGMIGSMTGGVLGKMKLSLFESGVPVSGTMLPERAERPEGWFIPDDPGVKFIPSGLLDDPGVRVSGRSP